MTQATAMAITVWVQSKNARLMKNIISTLMLLAASATAFVSCQKQENLASDKDTVTISGLTFSSEKPELEGETKTVWDGVAKKIKWERTDKISVAYTSDGIWQNADGTATASSDAKIYASNILNDDGLETGQFALPNSFALFTGEAKVFYGVYPSSAVDSNFDHAPSTTITIPSEQTPATDSFDSAADFMIGVSDELTTVTPRQAISLTWERQVAHAQITLSALNNSTAGEKVSSIILTANSEANMVGKFYVKLNSHEVTLPTGNTAPNVITIKGTNLSAVDASGNVTFWASFLPCNVKSLNVVVETDKATYTRDITTCNLDFQQNKRNILTINMSTATRTAKAAEVVLYEESFNVSKDTGFSSYSVGSYVYSCSDDTKVMVKNNPDYTQMTEDCLSLARNESEGTVFNWAKISGINPNGAKSVTVSWTASATGNWVSISESAGAAVQSKKGSENSAVFSLNGTEESITLFIENRAGSTNSIDNIKIVKTN